MAKKPTIRPLKIKELEDADRAFEQITESVNGLLGGVHLTEVVYTKGFKVGELVKVPHKQGQTPSGVISGNGLRLVIESIDKNFVNLRVEPWYVFYRNNLLGDETTISIKDLKGDQDEEYIFDIIFEEGSGVGDNIDIRPNGATANLESQRLVSLGATVASANNASTWNLKNASNAEVGQFILWVYAKRTSAAFRQFHSSAGMSRPNTSTTDIITHQTAGAWRDNTTELGSLDLVTASNGFGKDTQVIGKKLVPTQTDIRILVY